MKVVNVINLNDKVSLMYVNYDFIETTQPGSIESMNKEDVKSQMKMIYMHKLGAFDDDYAVAVPTIIFR